MAKRKPVTVPPSVIKFVFVVLIFLTILILIYQSFRNFLWTAPYFKIRSFVIEDPNLQFIVRDDLARYRGRSIFGVNVQDLQRQLAAKYPQVSSLKIIKNFPDQISVVAKKRYPALQLLHKGKTIVLDTNGVIMGSSQNIDSNVTFLTGVKLNIAYFGLGVIVRDQRVLNALKIKQLFKLTSGLSSVKILKIDVQRVSEVEVYLSDDFKIIFDAEKMDDRVKVLAMMITQGRLNVAQLNYIDLRFNEPILGKREP